MLLFDSTNYQLLDSGNGYLLERFGENIIARPEATAIWKPNNPIKNWKIDAFCEKGIDGKIKWITKPSFDENWYFKYKNLIFELRFSNSKNIGIFPEQIANWIWIEEIIKKVNREISVLNLFAYTGAATLVAANAGAVVCHVDASKAAIKWASKNKDLSNLNEAKIRWIVDDCSTFLKREIKRGAKYDGIILDPPSFGRANGKMFKFENNISELLELCSCLLSENSLFFLLNCYSMRYSKEVVRNLLYDYFPSQDIEYDELLLKESVSRNFSASIFARFSKKLNKIS